MTQFSTFRFENDVLLIFQADDEFGENDYMLDPFHLNFFYRHVRALLGELYIRHFEHGKQKFPSFTLFLDTHIKQTKIISNSTMSLFISTTRPFDYNASDQLKSWGTRAEMRETSLLLKIEQYFSPTERSPSNGGVLGKTALENSPRKTSVRERRDGSPAREIRVIRLGVLEVAVLPQGRATMERFSTVSKILERSARK